MNKIYEIPNLLTSDECDKIINLSRDKVKRSMVIGENGNDVSNISAEYFQYDLEILQSFIDNNESLGDLQVLVDFTKLNHDIELYHPLLLGYQLWKNNRLQQLSLDGWGISQVPESIRGLDQLKFLNLNNNVLENLPEGICEIYSNLNSLEVTNNMLCPPYPDCFEFIGYQNTENCQD